MKLLLISESPLEQIGDRYYAADPWIYFPVWLASECEQLTLLAPVAVHEKGHTPSEGSWPLDLGNLKIANHDNYNSFIKYYRLWISKAFVWRRRIDELVKGHDIVLIRLPSPAISMVARSALRMHKRLVLFVAGDIEKQSDLFLRAKGLKKLIYGSIIKFLRCREARWGSKASILYAYNRDLTERYRGADPSRVKLIRTPHLKHKDFKYRNDTCLNDEIGLLRVSWLVPTKGLEFLLEAVKILANKNYNIKLELVGKERHPGYGDELKKLAKSLRIEDKVVFAGWAPYTDMPEVYMRNDIQVISSLAEGTPRVIVEGAAHGLPLVSTAVGGCADNLIDEQDALLVPPKDSAAIADAIERIIKDAPLRRRMIANGYDMAKKCTFETMGMQIAEDLNSLC